MATQPADSAASAAAVTSHWYHDWHEPTDLVHDHRNFRVPSTHLHGHYNASVSPQTFSDYRYKVSHKRPVYRKPDAFLTYLLSLSVVRPPVPYTNHHVPVRHQIAHHIPVVSHHFPVLPQKDHHNVNGLYQHQLDHHFPGSNHLDNHQPVTHPPNKEIYPGHQIIHHEEISHQVPVHDEVVGHHMPYQIKQPIQHHRVPEPEPLERTGPFKIWYYWNQIDFAYLSPEDREKAILYGDFIPENNLPLGLEVWKDRLFVTMPKWKTGVPASLTVIPKVPREPSPKLVPYPSWRWHQTGTCDAIISVFRIQADSCNRLWVLDSGQITVTTDPNQICPPKLLIFDLLTDQLLTRYDLPPDQVKKDGLFSNLMVDIRENDCINVHAYLTDVWRFGLVVFSLEKMRSWLITDHLFFPEPLAAAYKVHHLEFEWTDGLFALALSPTDKYTQDRILYFHVPTSVVCNETGWAMTKHAFEVMGQSRGKNGHVSAHWMDKKGILFYNMVTRDSIGCWDSGKPYKRDNLGVVAQSSETLVFPNDIKIDQEERQSVWVLSNKLPFYLYETLDKDKVNFRIMSAYTDEAIEGTICDPKRSSFDTYVEYGGEEDCY
ncbi:unnamed protein product [Acanthoscelides obtectus]|uniref:Uncharacterized protein n=1 Tax=Acanthoscelides obtectus TaxID=200917 RepID=A0A9P0KS96_ACAOB|nr:unnamed protein product [Acanthoscelides obtectus]CAK1635577.1 Protein yellow [Acanthoscelides obtectus]